MTGGHDGDIAALPQHLSPADFELIVILLMNHRHRRPAEPHVHRPLKVQGGLHAAEEHSVIGGLGGAVCEALAETCPVPVCRIGIQDVFGESGSAGALLAKYGLDGDGGEPSFQWYSSAKHPPGQRSTGICSLFSASGW